MEKPKSKFLITSAIPYINGVKHLGNLPARCCQRTCMRAFAGSLATTCCSSAAPTSTARRPSLAQRRPDKSRSAYCDAQHALQADVYGRFGLSFDHFGRSSSAENHALTQHFYRRLDAAGLIDERDVRQVWSPADRRFLQTVTCWAPARIAGSARRAAINVTNAMPCSIRSS